MLKHFIRLLTVLFSFSILLVDCTSSVSGVETGNPAKTAFARIALELFDAKDAWVPSSYLVNGTDQLDTTALYSKPVTAQALPKTSAFSDSLDTCLIIEHIDTIIKISAVVVRDTLVKSYYKTDTVINIDSGWSSSDSNVIISQKLYTDSIFILDTVEITDTSTILKYDTICKSKADWTSNTQKSSGVTVQYIRAASLAAFFNDTAAFVRISNDKRSFNQQVQYNTVSTVSPVKISRKSVVAGIRIAEEYTDADGDGILVAGNNNSLSRLNLDARYAKDEYNLSLKVLFDAGADVSFGMSNDNRIYSLVRNRNIEHVLTEAVTFISEQSFQLSDTLALNITKTFESDTVASSSTRYLCVPGNDRYDYRQNGLCGLTHEVGFRNSSLKNIRINLVVDTLVLLHKTPSSASIEACIDYGKGKSSVFNGTVDYTKKIVYGIYAENGSEFKFEYHYTDDSYSIDPVE